MDKAIRDTLTRMNWTFGKGDIIAVNLFGGAVEQAGIAIRSMPFAGMDKRRFTILDHGRRVRFLGRVRVIRA